MTPDQLADKLQEQRKISIDLGGGKSVQFHRATRLQMQRFIGLKSDEELCDKLCSFGCGWAGFTQADLLGAALGASDDAPFSKRLLGMVLGDDRAYFAKVAADYIALCSAQLGVEEGVAKNSQPSLT